jgi:tetratricopeptide (TPR) repeat protein
MSSRISLWVGLIGIAATIPLVQTIASAKTSVEIADTATAITVLITSPKDEKGFIPNGSGVILQRQGDIYTVLTAAHVVKNKVSYKITTPDDRAYEVISSSIRSAPGSVDLAVVKFKSITKYPTAKLGNCNVLKSGMDLYVAGFPGGSKAINELIFVFREGKVTANSNKVLENGYSLVYSNSTLPGMSGGAVLNSDGELVAIHGRGDRDENDIKTGFNLGIPVNRFAMVASNMGVELGGQVAAIPQNTAPKADDYVASAAQKSLNRERIAKMNFKRGRPLADRNRGVLDDLTRGILADLDRAVQLDPKNANVYQLRAWGKWETKDNRGALADFDRAIQINPNLAIAYRDRALLKGDMTNYKLTDELGLSIFADLKQAFRLLQQQNARDDFRVSISLSREQNGSVYATTKAALMAMTNAYGIVKHREGNYREAIEYFSQLIAIDPQSSEGYVGRGKSKFALKDYSGAIADYKQALSNHTAEYKERLSNYSKRTSDFPSPDYQSYLNDIKSTISDMQQAAKLQGDLKSYQFAVEYLKKIEGDNNQPIATNSSNAESYYSQGDKKADAGNYREAIEDFSRSIALNAKHAQAYVGRGRSKYELKDYSGAISDYKQAISIAPQYASAYFNLGLAKAKSNDLKGAISDMQQATKLYQQQGKQQDAQDAIAQIKQWQQTSNNSGF